MKSAVQSRIAAASFRLCDWRAGDLADWTCPTFGAGEPALGHRGTIWRGMSDMGTELEPRYWVNFDHLTG